MSKEWKVLGSYPNMLNSREGFEQFVEATDGLKAKHGLTNVLIGLEPTGHYWRKFAYFVKGKWCEVRFVRTTALKHHRELDESSSAKSDQRDALTLTNITREGKYIDTVIEYGRMRQLRALGKVREKIQRRNVSAKTSLHAVLDDYFHELKKIFWSMHARGLWALLQRCPFPVDVVTLKDDVAPASQGIGLSWKTKCKLILVDGDHFLFNKQENQRLTKEFLFSVNQEDQKTEEGNL
jgi:hypothetical protein